MSLGAWWNLRRPHAIELDVIAEQAFEAGFRKGIEMIKIESGPSPKVRELATATDRKWAEVIEAAGRLRPGQWFIVPASAGKIEPKTRGRTAAGLKRLFKSRFPRLFLAVAVLDEDKGIMVKLPEEAIEEAPAGEMIPTPYTPPKVLKATPIRRAVKPGIAGEE